MKITKSKVRISCFVMMVLLMSSCNRTGMQYDASGTFETQEVIISAETPGKILELNIQEGAEIKEGDILGVIDTMQLYLSKLQLKTSIKAVTSRKTNVNTQIAVLQEQLATAQKEKQRIEKLLQASAVNRKQLDDVNAQIAVLERQIAAQRSAMESGNSSISEESSVLEIQIAQLDDKLKKSYISSPINGTVLVKYAEKGEMAAPGKALFKVANTDEMILRAYVSASQFTQLKIGQELSVFADFGEKDTREYKGAVTWISEKAEFTPKTVQTRDERDNLVYAIKVRVKNDGYLKIGMYGGVKLVN